MTPIITSVKRQLSLLRKTFPLTNNNGSLFSNPDSGWRKWLKPYCIEVLKQLPREGIKVVDVVCPGFAVDCLETLEEIAITNRQLFLQSGGTDFRYIPALNCEQTHVGTLAALIAENVLN